MANDSKKNSVFTELAPYLNLGWQLVITICLMSLLGWWLDKKLNTSPWLLIILTLFGCAAGIYNFIKTVLSLNKKKPK